jgi:protein-tyrosine phosphatase
MGHDRGVEQPTRIVPLTGAFNFRDLGGYPAGPGVATRWGTLYRSDALHLLTEADVALIRSLGVATVIDLRTDAELIQVGRGPLADHPLGFHHLSVIGDGRSEASGEAVAAPAPSGDELSGRYLWYLEQGRQPLATALGVLAEPDTLPVVFHCAAGKDRTGVLAALVLDLLGVEPEVIVADYVITAERMPLIMERFRSDPIFADRMDSLPPSRFGVTAATMEGFLRGLHDDYGGARQWALDAGVPDEALDTLVDRLLEPSG